MRQSTFNVVIGFLLTVFALSCTSLIASAAQDAGPSSSSAVVATLVDPGVDVGAYLKALANAFENSDWRYLASLLIVGVVWGLRKWGAPRYPWFGTDRGGAALALLCGVGGALANMIAIGVFSDLSVGSIRTIAMGLVNGVFAAGGYVVVKRLLGISNPPTIVG